MKILTIIFIFITNFCFSQNKIKCTKRLIGEVHVIVIFSSNYNNEWKDFEKTEKLRLIEENMKWVQKKANKYNQTFTFEIKKYGGNCDKKIKYNGVDVLLIEQAIDSVIKCIANEIPQSLINNTNQKNVICVIFHKDKGRSFANPSYISNFFLDYCVIYERHRNGVTCDNSVIGHEILHLFGAVDLYSDNNDLNFRNLVNKYCKNDIMSKTGNLNTLLITEFTAYKLGWIPENKNFSEIVFYFK
jgi:hypothetical protein